MGDHRDKQEEITSFPDGLEAAKFPDQTVSGMTG
jgi:hypothetical protein